MADDITPQDSSQVNNAQTEPAVADQTPPAASAQPVPQPAQGAPNATGVSTPPPDSAIKANATDQGTTGPQTTPATTNQQIPEKGPQQAPTAQKPVTPPTPPPSRAQVLGNHIKELGGVLAGGPTYKYKTDANTGTITREEQPVSGKHIAMAVALEALTGGLAGLGKTGPNKYSEAATAGLQAGEKIQQGRQQQDAAARQLAQENFTRNYQTTNANMHMLQLAMNSSAQNNKFREDMIATNEATIAHLKQFSPGSVVEEHLPGQQAADMKKYPLNEYTRRPDGYIPKIGSDGQPIWQDPRTGAVVPEGTPGAQEATELTYSIIKNDAKVDVTDQDGNPNPTYARAAKLGLPDITKTTGQISAGQDAEIHQAVMNFDNFEANTNKFYDTLNGGKDNTTAAPLKMPEVEDTGIQDQLDAAAKKYGVPQEIVRAIANQESGGNENATSPKGATGVMQLMPATAKMLGVDPNDTAQNIDGGVKYFSQLLSQYKGNTKLALAAYNAGPGNVTDHVPQNGETEKYVSAISNAVGLDETQKVAPSDKITAPDFEKEVSKNKALLPAMTTFNSALTANGGSYEKAMAVTMQQNPAGGAALMNLLAGSEGNDRLKQVDNAIRLKQETTEANMKAQVSENETAAKNAQKTASDNESASRMVDMLTGPPSYEYKPEMAAMPLKDLKTELTSQGVKVPFNIDELYAMSHYQASPDSYHPRIWRKGDPNGMSKGDAGEYIRRYINPDYDDKKYGSMSTEQRALYNPDSKVNKGIVSIATATDHIAQLQDAAKAAASGEAGGQYPILNKLAQDFGVKISGTDQFKDLQVVANAVNNEVTTALAGGYAPHEAQVSEGFNNLKPADSLGQINRAAKSYMNLMAARAQNQNEPIKKTTGKDIPFLTQHTIDNFAKNGIDTSWYGSGSSGNTNTAQNNTAPTPKPGEQVVWLNGKALGYSSDGKNITRNIGQ